MRHAIAIACWVLAWFCSGLIPAAWFAARDHKRTVALAELAAGFTGAAGFAIAGAVIW